MGIQRQEIGLPIEHLISFKPLPLGTDDTLTREVAQVDDGVLVATVLRKAGQLDSLLAIRGQCESLCLNERGTGQTRSPPVWNVDDDGAIDDGLEPGQVQVGIGEEEGISVIRVGDCSDVDGVEFSREVSHLAPRWSFGGAPLTVALGTGNLHRGIVVRSSSVWSTCTNTIIFN